MSEPDLPEELRAALDDAVGPAHVSTEPLDRVVHARGKCLRDLVRHLAGDVGRVPDAVVRPGTEAEVDAIMAAALKADCVLIPFGGGMNISGSLEPLADDPRPVLSVDLSRWTASYVDEASGLAVCSRASSGRTSRSSSARAPTAAPLTLARDEMRASADARSQPVSLLHPWKAAVTLPLSRSMQRGRAGSHRPYPWRAAPCVHASERRRVQASDARFGRPAVIRNSG